MRCSLVTIASLVAATALHAADDLQHNAGIGVGSMLFQGQTGLVQQVLAVTTNQSLSQTVSISLGLLGARQPTSLVSNEAVQLFVRDNMDQLAREMAAGQGESIDTLAELIAVPADQRSGFARNLQAQFETIYSSPVITSSEVVEHLARVVEKT